MKTESTKNQGFEGEFRFLSNFWMTPFTIDTWRWPSAEHAYQAIKSENTDDWRMIQRLPHPREAKAAGAKLNLRPNWDQLKIQYMTEIINHKFNVPHLAEMLVNTGDMELVEWNYWNDTFWGVSIKTHKGHNYLGKILMEKRRSLQA